MRLFCINTPAASGISCLGRILLQASCPRRLFSHLKTGGHARQVINNSIYLCVHPPLLPSGSLSRQHSCTPLPDLQHAATFGPPAGPFLQTGAQIAAAAIAADGSGLPLCLGQGCGAGRPEVSAPLHWRGRRGRLVWCAPSGWRRAAVPRPWRQPVHLCEWSSSCMACCGTAVPAWQPRAPTPLPRFLWMSTSFDHRACSC